MKNLLKEKGYLAFPLIFTKTSHLEIKAQVNGIEGTFILDTGASNTCIGIEFVDFFNLKMKKSEIKASGAGALGMDTHISNNNSLQIGKWFKSKVNIVIFDLSHVNQALLLHNISPVNGIIGADILKKHKAIIDYSKKTLFLLKK